MGLDVNVKAGEGGLINVFSFVDVDRANAASCRTLP